MDKADDIATLHDGTEESVHLVDSVCLNLKRLLTKDPIAFFEAVMIAREPSHRPFGVTKKTIKELGLVSSEEGGMHESIRAIILNAVVGEMPEMELRSPLAKEADDE